MKTMEVLVAAGLFCRKMDGRFCRKKPDTDVRRAGRIDVAGVFCRTREGRGQSRSPSLSFKSVFIYICRFMQFTSVVFVNSTNTTMTAESLSEYLPGVLRSSAYQIAAPGTP